MARYIDAEKQVDQGFLEDWYISSVMDTDEPVWTEEHIRELTGDFILIPRTEETAKIIQGEWTDKKKCSICSFPALLDGGEEYVFSKFCPNCGAKMDGKKV